MHEIKTFLITLSENRQALALRASVDNDPGELASALKLLKANGVVLLVGGAGLASQDALERMTGFINALAEVLVRLNITVIDGGTDAGVMALMGCALHAKGRHAPHIGILPAKAPVDDSGLLAEEIPEPHHSHFVLIDSNQWGGETAAMNSLFRFIASDVPALVVLVNGGEIALTEIELCVREGYDIAVVRGSGRLADEIADEMQHPNPSAKSAIKYIAKNGKLVLIPLSASVEEIENIISQKPRG